MNRKLAEIAYWHNIFYISSIILHSDPIYANPYITYIKFVSFQIKFEIYFRLQMHIWNNNIYNLGLPKTIKRLPKCVRFTNFEQFWIAEIILHWNYIGHFFLNHYLEVASLIQSFALSKRDQCISKHSLLR